MIVLNTLMYVKLDDPIWQYIEQNDKRNTSVKMATIYIMKSIF